MTSPHSISSGSAAPCPFCGDEIKHVESLARSFDPPRVYHEWQHPKNDNCYISRMRSIVENATDDPKSQEAALARWNTRTPALPSGEVEFTLQTPMTDFSRLRAEDAGFDNICWRAAQLLRASSPTSQIAGGVRALSPQAQAGGTKSAPVQCASRPSDERLPNSDVAGAGADTFSRWADTIESASLAISPKGSEALDALAAEVRAGGVAQAVRVPSDLHKVWQAHEACMSMGGPRESVEILYYEILRLNGMTVTGGDINALSAPSSVSSTSAPAQTWGVRLEARPADDSEEWTEIFPSQLEWAAKQGHQVRAIETPPLTSTDREGK